MALHRLHPGDVVWAPDPYHGDGPYLASGDARPWVVVSSEHHPPQGEEYLCCALTTTPRRSAALLALARADWLLGGPPRPSRLDPLTVFTLKHAWASRYLGRLAPPRVEQARERIRRSLAP